MIRREIGGVRCLWYVGVRAFVMGSAAVVVYIRESWDGLQAYMVLILVIYHTVELYGDMAGNTYA